MEEKKTYGKPPRNNNKKYLFFLMLLNFLRENFMKTFRGRTGRGPSSREERIDSVNGPKRGLKIDVRVKEGRQ